MKRTKNVYDVKVGPKEKLWLYRHEAAHEAHLPATSLARNVLNHTENAHHAGPSGTNIRAA